jgi:hypothetical protein
MISSTCAGSIPARLTASRTANAPKSTAEKGVSDPWNLPMAVRQAEMMTVSFIVRLIR